MSKKGDYPIPFDKQGNQLDYHEPKGWQPSILKDNIIDFDGEEAIDWPGVWEDINHD